MGAVLVILAGFLFISCSNPAGDPVSTGINAQQPNITAITGNPAASTWNVSSANTFSVTVTANSPDSGNLSYQWYSNSTNSNSGGTAINTGGTSATLSLAKAEYTENKDYYFYIVVTNTIEDNSDGGTKTATRTSNAATVTVSGNSGPLPVNARQPNITAITGNPAASTWNVSSANTFSVTVTANSPDSGNLSYQWYSNSTNSNSGGTAINTGGTSATLSLAKASYTENKNYYFYVVVTNTITNNGDGGTKTATRTSNAATVTVTGNAFVLDSKWVGTWEPENQAGDYFYIRADGHTEYDIFSMGFIPSGSPTYGWIGTICDVTYFDTDKGLIFVEYESSNPAGYGGWQTSGTGAYTAFYFEYSYTDPAKGDAYLMLNLALESSPGSGYYTQPMFEKLEDAKSALTWEYVSPQLIVLISYLKTP
jgi:hypothetical protein